MKAKYNIKATIALLEKLADSTQIITRAELINVLTGGKNMDTDLSAYMYHFKKNYLTPRGIKMEAIQEKKHFTKGDHCDYKVYRTASAAITATTVEMSAQTALEKDNQKLFLQLEALKADYDALKAEYDESIRREANYKVLIETYHSLAMSGI